MKTSLKIEKEEFDPEAVSLLAKINDVAPRSENAAQAGRAAFLEQAYLIKSALPAQPEWKPSRLPLLSRKWLFGLNPLLTILVVLSIILGSTTTTVYASQNTTPGQILYPVKIASEDLRLSLAPNSGAKVVMDIEFANRRLQEASALTNQQKGIPDSVSSRWGRHVDDIFEHSQQMSDTQMAQILLELQTGLQQQVQTTNQLTAAHPENHELVRLHNEIQASINLVEFGISNPTAFRQQIKTAGGKEIENEMESMEAESQGVSPGQAIQPSPSATAEQKSAAPTATLESDKNPAVSPTLQQPSNSDGNQGQGRPEDQSQNSTENPTQNNTDSHDQGSVENQAHSSTENQTQNSTGSQDQASSENQTQSSDHKYSGETQYKNASDSGTRQQTESSSNKSDN
jgi:hypothetical protein